jgi:hypothetical protein
MKIATVIFLFITIVFAPSNLRAQQGATWGVIPNEFLQMKVYEPDTSASALVLFDRRQVLRTTFKWTMRVHRRIKLFNASAFQEYGSYIIPIVVPNQSVVKIEGITHKILENGATDATLLKDESIFEEEVLKEGSVKRYRFTMPKLEAGAVVEFRYEIDVNFPPLYPFIFQEEIPVLWSEYCVSLPEKFEVSSVRRGNPIFAIDSENHSSKTSQVLLSLLGSSATAEYVYAMQNIPAVRREPFAPPIVDLVPSIELIILGVNRDRFVKNWETFINSELDDIAKVMGNIAPLKRLADSVAAPIEEPEKKMFALAEFAQRKFHFRDKRGRGRDANQEDDEDDEEKPIALDTDFGVLNINLALVQMLKSQKLEAYPLYVSKREYGETDKTNPIKANRFNFYLAYILINGKEFVLDATDTCRPVDLLDNAILETDALVLKRQTPVEWIRLSPTKKNKRRSQMTLAVENPSLLKGSLTVEIDEYSAYIGRSILEKQTSEEFIKSLIGSAGKGVQYDTFAIKNKFDTDKPMTIDLPVTCKIETAGNSDFIYLSSSYFDRLEKNPFLFNERRFPIDLKYLSNYEHTMRLTLPKGVSAKEFPDPVVITLSSNDTHSVRYERTVSVDSLQLEIRNKFIINRTKYSPTEYASLKKFYDSVIACDAEQIVLQQKRLSSGATTRPIKPKKKK